MGFIEMVFKVIGCWSNVGAHSSCNDFCFVHLPFFSLFFGGVFVFQGNFFSFLRAGIMYQSEVYRHQ